MKLECVPANGTFSHGRDTLKVVLYGQPRNAKMGSAGATAKDVFLQQGLVAAPRAWDFLSLALAVVSADAAGRRSQSPDGWTREFDLKVAVADPEFWQAQTGLIESALQFLTTDRWRLGFMKGGYVPAPPRKPIRPDEDCVVLLSGGLDSLVGAIDLVAAGRKPCAVSQIVRGDARKQVQFASSIGAGLRHVQLNHNASVPGDEETSQRSRSLIFLAFGVLGATSLARYYDGDVLTLYVCENGFIAVNPALTAARVGSLSTRTAHPVFLKNVQGLLNAAGLRVRIENPYQQETKGEMLANCADQDFLKANAAISTSCGRFQRFGYRQCGRCIPCQIRRAAFLRWGVRDGTDYVYRNLGKRDEEHAAFDDVRSAAMAIREVMDVGVDAWLGTSLSSAQLDDVDPLKAMVQRGLDELAALHKALGVK